jgi:hypothetical protein
VCPTGAILAVNFPPKKVVEPAVSTDTPEQATQPEQK